MPNPVIGPVTPNPWIAQLTQKMFDRAAIVRKRSDFTFKLRLQRISVQWQLVMVQSRTQMMNRMKRLMQKRYRQQLAGPRVSNNAPRRALRCVTV